MKGDLASNINGNVQGMLGFYSLEALSDHLQNDKWEPYYEGTLGITQVGGRTAEHFIFVSCILV